MNRIRNIVWSWVMPKVQPGEAVIIVLLRMPDGEPFVEMQVRSRDFEVHSSNGPIYRNSGGQLDQRQGRRIQIDAVEEVLNYSEVYGTRKSGAAR